MTTPVAGYEGQVVAENMLHGNHRKAKIEGVPTVAFTTTPIASVGILEDEARSRNLRFRTQIKETEKWFTSRRIGERRSGFKVLIEEETDRVLGAHLFGHNAEEIINLFAVAIRSGLRASDLKKTIFAYPTHAANVQYML